MKNIPLVTEAYCEHPIIPFFYKILILNDKPNKIIYQKINTKSIIPTGITKWNNISNYDIIPKDVFNTCFKITPDTTIQWLQFRVLHRILPTSSYLKKIKIKSSDLCFFCDHETESIEHIFFDCEIIYFLWSNLEYIIYDRTNIVVQFDKRDVIFGKTSNDENFITNFIILYAKHYIYINLKKMKLPSLTGLLNHLKFHFECHKTLAMKKKSIDKFNIKWNLWKNIFQ